MGFANKWNNEAHKHAQKYTNILSEMAQTSSPHQMDSCSVHSVHSVPRGINRGSQEPERARKITSKALLNDIRARQVFEGRKDKERTLHDYTRSRFKVTPPLLATYKAARVWIMSRIDELEEAGWNRRSLFKIGKLAHPYGWGAAWSNIWLRQEAPPKLMADGCIRWTIHGKHKKAIQTMRPEAYKY